MRKEFILWLYRRQSSIYWINEQLGFGMFRPLGLYSQLGGGEWIYHMKHMKMSDYAKLKDSFTAEDFDADKLVLTAKRRRMQIYNAYNSAS